MRIKKVSNAVLENQVIDSASTDNLDNVSDVDYAHAFAIEHINKAIEALGKVASTESIAKESIANLSVVLLDLK